MSSKSYRQRLYHLVTSQQRSREKCLESSEYSAASLGIPPDDTAGSESDGLVLVTPVASVAGVVGVATPDTHFSVNKHPQ